MSKFNFDQYMINQEKLDLLRFITCGSVDDGKSTLIGRLLFETNSVFEDQLSYLESISKLKGIDNNLDFSILLDGLSAEQEQKITIDVAYKYFSTKKRAFIIADTPGHFEYTKNMITGCSKTELGVILIDVRKGILEQTLRHINICNFMGIKKIIFAINKMDLVKYNEKKFRIIEKKLQNLCKNFLFDFIKIVPISAITGENIRKKSKIMNWYTGKSFLSNLETVDVHSNSIKDFFLMPVQLVNRPDGDFRGFSGMIASGEINKGDEIVILPNIKKAKIKKIISGKKYVSKAESLQSVTLVLDQELSISRGDCITSDKEKIVLSDQFEANLFWMTNLKGFVGREYILKINTQTASIRIITVKSKLNINNGDKLAAKNLSFNNFYTVIIKTNKKIWFNSYKKNKTLGSFILIDKFSYETIAAGTISHEMRRSSNLTIQKFIVNKKSRRLLNNHMSKVFWFTGLSGSGKSTIANNFEKYLHANGIRSYILDGDNIRHGLNNDLGFKEEDRIENIRRIAEVSKLFVDAGFIVLTSVISPFEEERKMARKMFKKDEFIEVYISTPIEVCERRDVKGLYKKAREGKIINFTGIDSKYEKPKNPELSVDTEELKVDEIIKKLKKFI